MKGAGLAVSVEQMELAATVRRWVAARSPVPVVREALEAEVESRPPFWEELGDLGWLGLAVGEAAGGAGAGFPELAVVLEELGRGCVPGPFLTTAVMAVALDRWGGDREAVTSLVDGSSLGGVSVAAGGAVWGGSCADRFLLLVDDDAGTRRWVTATGDDLTSRELRSFDATRRLAEVTLDPARSVELPRLDCDPREVSDLLALAAAAEALGVAQWCVDTAASYAVDRVQFGRPIGQFQAVKHRCADMLVSLEAARAAVWDAARAVDSRDAGWELALCTATHAAPEAAFACAKGVIQILGGIGYTWEHDAHLYLKRATATLALLGGSDGRRRELTELVAAGVTRPISFELPPGAEGVRSGLAAEVAAVAARPSSEWNVALAETGLLTPHWPAPWGRDASPLEQLVIDEELAAAGIRRPHLGVAGWVLPTIIAHGSDAQRERWVMPSLRRELRWCQMFSEPGAGSDLASLTTSARRAVGPDGSSGWSITGQKVWTTMAREADWAICLARTNPGVARHLGITCFMVDMSTPGIDVRPLTELTGFAMFNEVFLEDVFVPDDCVVGGVDEGWGCARTTLANERVSMASGSSFGPGVAAVVELAGRRGLVQDPLVAHRIGGLVATGHQVAMLGVRATLRALGGFEHGPEASVRKLLGVEHDQLVQEVGLSLLGADAAVVDGDGATWTAGFLGNRALSIAGGTSEIQRNVIAERLLGLPKDP